MHINTQIARGMERLIARRESGRLEGMHGLSGFGAVDNFRDLGALLDEAGFTDVEMYTRRLGREKLCTCKAIEAALPATIDAIRLFRDGTTLTGLGKVKLNATQKAAVTQARADAKVAKIAAKSALSAARVGSKAGLAAAKGATRVARQSAKQAVIAAKAAAKVAKYDAKAATSLANAGVTANMTAEQAGAAVLTNESGVPLYSDMAQQFAQQVASNAGGGGSVVPTESMFAPQGESAPVAEGDGLIFGMTPVMAVGAGAATLGAVYLLFFRKKGR